MVATRSGRPSSRRGATRRGCLFSLLIAAFIGYYGVHLGGVYFKYWRIKQEMGSQARLAPSVDDATIRRRILQKMNELDLPAEAHRELRVQRMARPREIHIGTTYQQPIELPFTQYILTLRPRARQPL